MCVLVVDDDPLILELACRALRSAGHAVDCVMSGEAALRWMQNRRPKLVLLDAKMSGMSGFSVLRQLRGDVELREVPVVMLTGSRSKADVMQARELGVSGYVVKPFSTQALIHRVQLCLAVQNSAAPSGTSIGSQARHGEEPDDENWLV